MGKLSDMLKSVADGAKKKWEEAQQNAPECAWCGAKKKLFSFVETKDGVPLCPKCLDALSSKLLEKVDDLPFAQVKPYFEYYTYSQQNLLPKFQGHYRYEELRLDRANGLLRLGNRILDLRDIQECTLAFRPEKTYVKDGEWIGGEVKISITMDAGLQFDEVACFYTSVKPQKTDDEHTVRYDDPEDMQAFRTELFNLIRMHREGWDSGKFLKSRENAQA